MKIAVVLTFVRESQKPASRGLLSVMSLQLLAYAILHRKLSRERKGSALDPK